MATSTEELTNCVICTEIFTDPQVLPCDHVFCQGCVNRMTKAAGTIKCPNCSQLSAIDDVKPDFRLATFLDALTETTERFTKSSPTGTTTDDVTHQDTSVKTTAHFEASNQQDVKTDDVTQKHMTPPADDTCESCEENVSHSYCNQCEQWLCTTCKKVHGKLKASKNHTYTYTLTAQKSHQLKKDMVENLSILQRKSDEFSKRAKGYELAIKELKAVKKDAAKKSKQLRKAMHDEIDKHFDTIDERIDGLGDTELKSFSDQNKDMTVQMKACVDLTTKMEKLMSQSDSKLVAKGEEMLSQATKLRQALANPCIDTVEMPQVRFGQEQGWNLEAAVDLQILQVQRNVYVCNFTKTLQTQT